MRNVEEFINSGKLEMYVFGSATQEEIDEVEKMISLYPEVKSEYNKIADAVERYARHHAVEPEVTVKPFLMATIDYTERLMKGEEPEIAPLLSEKSLVSDFSKWLNRTDMAIPSDFSEYYAKIISFTAEATTAIVWIKEKAPLEKHDHEFERFLIVEGSCDIIVDEQINSLTAGDYFGVPLHLAHSIKITSTIPCKVILQRVAA